MLFSMLIVFYLFLGGCTAGLLLITAIHALVFSGRKSANEQEKQVFWRFTGYCYLVALVLIVLALLCLLFDLANPSSALRLFLNPTATPISIGAYVLTGTLILLAVLCFTRNFWPWSHRRAKQVSRVAEIIAVPFALATMSYTGVFLALVNTVPFWYTPWTVVLFVLSALSTGYALFSFIQGLTSRNAYLPAFAVSPHAAHIVILLAEIGALVGFILQAFGRTEVAVQRSLEVIFTGSLLGWFVGGVVLLGLLVPLVTEILLLVRERQLAKQGITTHRYFLPADIACLIGGFLLRYCLIAAGLH